MLCEEEHILLHKIAKDAVSYGLDHKSKLGQQELLPVDADRYPLPLREHRASFVTLKIRGELRGCIGTLEARQALINDVAYNAHAAAFSDSRFSPLTQQEFDRLDFHISVLTPAELISFHSQEDLINKIRPGIDGLVLEEGYNKGTFLPAVWESLPTTKEFLHHLKLKAGLPGNYWSDSIKVSRYTTESF